MIAGTFGGGGQSKSHTAASSRGEGRSQAGRVREEAKLLARANKEKKDVDRSPQEKTRGREPGKKGRSDKKNETGEKGRRRRCRRWTARNLGVGVDDTMWRCAQPRTATDLKHEVMCA